MLTNNSESYRTSTQIVVVGGGPAGTTVATMLARKGLSVILLERANFPRDHVGESLLPASMPVLKELGVITEVEQSGFLPKYGATMLWGSQPDPWSWYFSETNHQYPHAFQVWRPTFDKILLENSRKNGVDVRESHQVTSVDFLDTGSVTVNYIHQADKKGSIDADFIVDASGSNCLLARQLDLREWDQFFQNLAVYGYFKGGASLPDPDQTNIFIESTTNGWIWNIPLHTGVASVGAVVDSTYGQTQISQIGIKDFLLQNINQSKYTANMLKDAELVSKPLALKDWSYTNNPMAGDNYILVGDAACFIDPLFSSGVHLAFMSGILAAAHITTAMKDKDLEKESRRVYANLYSQEYQHFRELAKLFYSSNRTVDSYFWEARRLLGVDTSYDSRKSFIHAVAGQPPRGYERAVMERGQLSEELLKEINEVSEIRSSRKSQADSLLSGMNISSPSITQLTPILIDGTKIEVKAVLGDGEFQWGYVLITPDRPEGTECSRLVSELVSLMLTKSSLDTIWINIQTKFENIDSRRLERDILNTISILYTDGTITKFI